MLSILQFTANGEGDISLQSQFKRIKLVNLLLFRLLALLGNYCYFKKVQLILIKKTRPTGNTESL